MWYYFANTMLSGVEAPGQGSFGQGTGRIWLDNTQCAGSELELLDCMSSASGANSCTHAQDAGVKCGNNYVAAEGLLVMTLSNRMSWWEY